MSTECSLKYFWKDKIIVGLSAEWFDDITKRRALQLERKILLTDLRLESRKDGPELPASFICMGDNI